LNSVSSFTQTCAIRRVLGSFWGGESTIICIEYERRGRGDLRRFDALARAGGVTHLCVFRGSLHDRGCIDRSSRRSTVARSGGSDLCT